MKKKMKKKMKKSFSIKEIEKFIKYLDNIEVNMVKNNEFNKWRYFGFSECLGYIKMFALNDIEFEDDK